MPDTVRRMNDVVHEDDQTATMLVDRVQVTLEIFFVGGNLGIVLVDVGDTQSSGFLLQLLVILIDFLVLGFSLVAVLLGHGRQFFRSFLRLLFKFTNTAYSHAVLIFRHGGSQETQIGPRFCLMLSLRAHITFQHLALDDIGIHQHAGLVVERPLHHWLVRSDSVLQRFHHIAYPFQVRRDDLHNGAFRQLVKLCGLVPTPQEIIDNLGVFPGRAFGNHIRQPGNPAGTIFQLLRHWTSQRTVEISAQSSGTQFQEIAGLIVLIDDCR